MITGDPGQEREGDIKHSYADIGKARGVGYVAGVSLVDGLGDSWMMGCEPPVRQTVIGRSMLKRLPCDLALVIALTLSCMPFVLIPPVRVTAQPFSNG